MKGRHSLETDGELGNSARCDVFIGELFRGRFFQRPGPIRFQRQIFQEQSPVPRRTATFRIIHQAVVYAANEEIPRVQRQDVVAEFQRRGAYTSCDGRDAQFVPNGDRSRFRFHAEQAPVNDIQRDRDVVILAFRTRRRPDLAVYDGNGIGQCTCRQSRRAAREAVRMAPYGVTTETKKQSVDRRSASRSEALENSIPRMWPHR